MSTNNFYNKNASNIFAFKCDDEFIADDTIENIRCELSKDKDFIIINQYDNELRSFPGKFFGAFNISIEGFEFNLQMIIRSGYYEGCNLDWSLYYENNEYNTIDDIIEDFEYTSNNNCFPRLTKTEVKKYKNQISSFYKKAIKKVEKIFSDYSTPLNKVAQMSNGEALYKIA